MPRRSDVAERTDDGTALSYGEIVKYEDTPDGHLMVYGKATGTDLDGDLQRMNGKWLAKAMPEWMAAAGNLREQHSKIAAGVGKELAANGDDWMLKSLCVDEGTKEKIRQGVLKGYSINVLNARVTKGTPSAPNGEIVGGTIGEISYVDRPCLPTATISICKALGDSGDLTLSDAEELDTLDDDEEITPPEASGVPEVVKTYASLEKALGGLAERLDALQETVSGLNKRDFSQRERDAAADSGAALPDGSFPIKSAEDLANAARLVGHAKDPAAARAHIKRRARALGLPNPLKSPAGAAKALGSEGVQTGALDKAEGSASIADQITKAVSRATAEITAAHEAEIATLRAKVDKVLATPVQGAPVIMGALPRPATTRPASRRDEYLEKALRASNQDAREMWRDLAAREPSE